MEQLIRSGEEFLGLQNVARTRQRGRSVSTVISSRRSLLLLQYILGFNFYDNTPNPYGVDHVAPFFYTFL